MTPKHIALVISKAEKIFDYKCSPKMEYVIHTKEQNFIVRGSSVDGISLDDEVFVFVHNDKVIFIPFELITYIELRDFID